MRRLQSRLVRRFGPRILRPQGSQRRRDWMIGAATLRPRCCCCSRSWSGAAGAPDRPFGYGPALALVQVCALPALLVALGRGGPRSPPRLPRAWRSPLECLCSMQSDCARAGDAGRGGRAGCSGSDGESLAVDGCGGASPSGVGWAGRPLDRWGCTRSTSTLPL